MLVLGACSSPDENPGGAEDSDDEAGHQTESGDESGQTGRDSSEGDGSTSGTSGTSSDSSSAGSVSSDVTSTGSPTSGANTSSDGEEEGSRGEGSGGEDSGSDDAATTGTSGDECTRALLDGLLDDYFAALSAGDPSSLPLAETVKFTENAQEVEIGTTDFWMNAGETRHSQRALDTDACSVGAQAVIPENGMDLPVAIRIKVENGEMVEIETIVVRPGDYTASFAVDSNPAAIIDIADDIGWHVEVPPGERATREQLTDWIDKYFRAFPSGVCDVTSACRRLENGGGDFSCSTGASCNAGDPGPGGTFEPRVILADEERGIALGFTIFDFMTTGHLDMHMIKMSNGEVHAVQAILRDTNGQSGWD